MRSGVDFKPFACNDVNTHTGVSKINLSKKYLKAYYLYFAGLKLQIKQRKQRCLNFCPTLMTKNGMMRFASGSTSKTD